MIIVFRQTQSVYRRVQTDAIAFRTLLRLFNEKLAVSEGNVMKLWVRWSGAIRHLISVFCLVAVLPMVHAQTAENPLITAVYTYADVADLSLAADITAVVRVKKAKRLKGPLAQGVAQGRQRYIVTADVVSLIRGTGGIDPRVSYLIDLPVDSRGTTESMSKREYIIFALASRPGQVRLVAPDAQIPSSPEAGAMVRRILVEALRPAAPPKLIGLSSAFYTEGNLSGEGETQFFLDGEGGRSVSISVVHSASNAVTWQVAINEVVDEGSGPPRRNTLLWYRLACSLPTALPADILVGQAPEAVTAIERDYGIVMQGLGQCKRARPPLAR
jgi:hypothetical protein